MYCRTGGDMLKPEHIRTRTLLEHSSKSIYHHLTLTCVSSINKTKSYCDCEIYRAGYVNSYTKNKICNYTLNNHPLYKYYYTFIFKITSPKVELFLC